MALISQSKKLSIAQLLDRQRDRFDALCGEVERGIRGPEHFDELEEEASDIGRELRDAFRRGAR